MWVIMVVISSLSRDDYVSGMGVDMVVELIKNIDKNVYVIHNNSCVLNARRRTL